MVARIYAVLVIPCPFGFANRGFSPYAVEIISLPAVQPVLKHLASYGALRALYLVYLCNPLIWCSLL